MDMVSLKVVTEAQVWLLKAMEMSRCQAALVCLVMLVCQAVLADTVVINTLVVATGLQVQAAIHLAVIATMEATKVNQRPSGRFGGMYFMCTSRVCCVSSSSVVVAVKMCRFFSAVNE